MELRTDIHHLNWTRADWSKRRYSKLIRDHELSKEKMVIGIHRELHRYVEPVAPPNLEIGRYVLSRLNEMPSFWVPLDAAKALRDELEDDATELSRHYDRQIPFLELSRKALKQTVV